MNDVERVEPTHEQTPPTERRLWFRIEEVEITWLPVGEAAFLLWVLAVLLVAWLLVGVALGLV
ncbi:MAG TPA: hypothetical protein VKB07_07970 [Gaiellaceae bacterium]|nr:hypothetical protein [Gaiellaceae bacterium]